MTAVTFRRDPSDYAFACLGERSYSRADIESRATSTEALIRRQGGYILVAFRGTKEPRDWMTDLEAGMTPFEGGGMVHRGFKRAYQSVRPEIIGAIKAKCGETDRRFLTLRCGFHSLGGALGTLLAADALSQPESSWWPGRVELVTGGCPRVGNEEFTEIFDNIRCSIRRYVTPGDVVTHFPHVLWPRRTAKLLAAFAAVALVGGERLAMEFAHRILGGSSAAAGLLFWFLGNAKLAYHVGEPIRLGPKWKHFLRPWTVGPHHLGNYLKYMKGKF